MYQKVVNKARLIFEKLSFPDAGCVILFIVGFMSGGAQLFSGLSPFGVSCVAAYASRRENRFFLFLPALGYALSGRGFKGLYYILACLIICAVSFKPSFFDKYNLWDALGAVSIALCGVVNSILGGLYIYDIAVVLLEGIAAYFLTGFYKTFSFYFSSDRLRRTVTGRELTALIVVAFGTLSALSGVTFIFDITLAGVISVFLILCCATQFKTGLCTAVGTVLGIFAGISNPLLIYAVGSYSVSAFFSSLAGRYGKICTALTFIITNAIMTFYVNGSEEVLINLYEILVAAMLFFIVPARKITQAKENIMLLMSDEETEEKKKMDILKGVTSGRLKSLSGAFSSLASVLARNEKRKNKLPEKELREIVESVAERTCRNCRSCRLCWKDNFENTYNVIAGLVGAVEKRGWAGNYDLPSYFKNDCYNSSAIVLEVNKVYEIYRVNMVWENRLAENKQVISQQLEGVSRAVSDLAGEVERGCRFLSNTEKSIIELLDSVGCEVSSVSVMQGSDKRLKICVVTRKSHKNSACENLITAAVNKVTGKNMRVYDEQEREDAYVTNLKEDENFAAYTAVSRVRPEGESEWGDSYAVITPGGGKMICALSDGMGTGKSAARESNETVNLLEKLLVAGIDKTTAVKLINSVLILKSFDESFATLDMLVLDLYTGEGEFVKTGGVSSFVKRGKQIIEVRSGSLPSGIIGGAEASNHKITLKDGDMVVIVSDGVTDVKRDGRWLAESIRESEITEPKAFADSIMASACTGISRCTDDMTVICVKICQK